MSADNWTICPKCRKDNKDKIKAAYGKVTQEEFCTLLNKKNEQGETLREDYEIGMSASGELEVLYSCSCDKCGFRFEYKHTEQMD